MADPKFLVHDVRVVVTEETMADHIRKQVRDAAVAALTTALVPGVVRGVYPGRVHPLEDTSLPAVMVYTGAEAVDRTRDVLDRSGQWRELELVVEIQAKAASTASPSLLAILDNVALEAEKVLHGDATLAGLLKELDVATTATVLEGENTEQPVGTMTITWGAVYRCNPADPSVLA